MMNTSRNNIGIPPIVKYGIGGFILLIISIIGIVQIVETNMAGYTVICQSPIDGNLRVITAPGPFYQGFGTITSYNQVATVSFGNAESSGTINVPKIAVRFNDSGKADIFGVARFELPTDEIQMLKIHTQYRNYEHLANTLLEKTLADTLVVTASMFSSEDTYGGARAQFQQMAEDQLKNGKYITDIREEEITDPETKEKRRVKRSIIRKDAQGNPLRIENPLEHYGIRVAQLTIDKDFEYETGILNQIDKQREAFMQTVTARSEAMKATQEAITTEAKGKAAVMAAEYEKLVEKKRAEVEAQQIAEVARIEAERKKSVAQIEKEQAEIEANKRLEVAKLDKQAAEETKQQFTLLGEGEAARKRAVMEADGALEQKLMALYKINENYANAISNYQGDWTPKVMFGGNGQGGTLGIMDMIQVMIAKSAKDLAIDLETKTNK